MPNPVIHAFTEPHGSFPPSLAGSVLSSPASGGVGVKPLEWTENPETGDWHGRGIVGVYVIAFNVDERGEWWSVIRPDGEEIAEAVPTDETDEAKSIAQKSYERCIRSAFTHPASGSVAWHDVDYLMSIIDAAIEDGFDPDEDGPLLDEIRANLKAGRSTSPASGAVRPRSEAELEALPAHPLAAWRTGLPLGLHRVHWASGGSSLCAVGMQSDGRRWIAPCNWVGPSLDPESDSWAEIERTELLFAYPEPSPERLVA